MNTSLSKSLLEKIEDIQQTADKAEELKKAMYATRKLKNEKDTKFFEELIAPYYDYKTQCNGILLIPIGINNFIKYPSLEKIPHRGGLIISGYRTEYLEGKLIDPNRTAQITLSDWLELPEEIKRQDMSYLQSPQDILKFVPYAIFKEHKVAQTIVEKGDFHLVICKERVTSSSIEPKQLSIICFNPTPENQHILDNALENTMTQSKSVMNSSARAMPQSVVLEENSIVSKKVLLKHESLLVHLFGEGIVDKAISNIKNTRNIKSSGNKGYVKISNNKNLSQVDLSKIRLD